MNKEEDSGAKLCSNHRQSVIGCKRYGSHCLLWDTRELIEARRRGSCRVGEDAGMRATLPKACMGGSGVINRELRVKGRVSADGTQHRDIPSLTTSTRSTC